LITRFLWFDRLPIARQHAADCRNGTLISVVISFDCKTGTLSSACQTCRDNIDTKPP
jgi:hypothetical protein